MEYPRETQLYRPDRKERCAARRRPKNRLRRGFHFRVEVGNDVLEGRDRLLNRGNLHQLSQVHEDCRLTLRPSWPRKRRGMSNHIRRLSC